MTNRSVWLLLFITSVIVLSMSLWPIKGQNILEKITIPIQEDKQSLLTDTIQEMPLSNFFTATYDKNLKAPSFVLMATKGNRALITINAKPCQWFHTGDTLIGHYTLYNIDNTLVTIFDGKGAYYEISLNDAPMEEEVFEDDENIVAQGIPNTKGMTDLEDGQYISYGDRDVSSDTGETTFDQASPAVDTSDQTITYGTKDVSQDISPEDEPPTLR